MQGELVGDKITLRRLHADYINDYCAALSPAICSALHLHTLASEHAYLTDRLSTPDQPFFYVIFDLANRLIGGLEIRTPDVSRGQLYSWIHESYWGTGCFREALALASQEYFRRFCVPFFSAHVDEANKRSYWALKKSGFADYGICHGPHGRQYRLIMRRR